MGCDCLFIALGASASVQLVGEQAGNFSAGHAAQVYVFARASSDPVPNRFHKRFNRHWPARYGTIGSDYLSSFMGAGRAADWGTRLCRLRKVGRAKRKRRLGSSSAQLKLDRCSTILHRCERLNLLSFGGVDILTSIPCIPLTTSGMGCAECFAPLKR